MSDPVDIRALPSGSTMARTIACPAWLARSREVPFTVPEKQWTSDGTKIHAILSDEEEEDREDESDEIEMAVGICKNKEDMLLVSIGFEDYETVTEERLWLCDERGRKLASGQPDHVHISGDKFSIFDWKTGRKDVPSPAKNAQLISYAVMVAEKHGLQEGFLGIIPAWRQTPPLAEITNVELAQWRTAILSAIAETLEPNPRAKAGPWCDYCPCRPFCPEALAIVRLISEINVHTFMLRSQPAEILETFKLAKHAQSTIKDLLDALKERLSAHADAVPGLTVGKGGEMKTIPGSMQSVERMLELYSPDIVYRAAKWTPAALAKSITGGKGAKKAQEAIEEELQDVIVVKQKSGSLELTA